MQINSQGPDALDYLDTWMWFQSMVRLSMDPFAGIINEGAVFGRGACDMKVFGNSLQHSDHFPVQKRKRGLMLMYTDEVGCVGASHMVHQCQHLDTPSNTLIGEPTSQQIFHHHGGHCTLEITIKGFLAHSSNLTRRLCHPLAIRNMERCP